MTTPMTKATTVGADHPETITAHDLDLLYGDLSAPFPVEAVERTSGKPREQGGTGKGYDTAGIKAQHVTNRLNEILGPAHWRVLDTVTPTDQRDTQSNRKMYEYVSEVTIQIGNPGDPWEVIAERKHYGGHMAMSHGDAMKGARTNGFKKAAAEFGIGREAWEGVYDDDNAVEKANGRAPAAPPTPEDPDRDRRRAFALGTELAGRFEAQGVSEDMLASYIRQKYGVDSRADLSPTQWKQVADALARGKQRPRELSAICERIKNALGPAEEVVADVRSF